MQLSVKNVEYILAKSVKTNEEYGEVELATYKVSRNREKLKSEKYLEVSIFGKIENAEYPLHFIIEKPFEEFLKIEKYKSINIDSEKIIDSYIMIDGLADLNLTIEGKVTRFSESLLFTMFFKVKEKYYGNVEFEVHISE